MPASLNVRRSSPFAIILAASIGAASLAPPGLHLDHVPLAVRDLPVVVAQFRSLGFTIKPGRPHQNGIENASIKLADGSYVEIITAHDGSDPLARRYEQFLKTGEGASYVFLRDSQGTLADRARRAGGRRSEAGPFAFTELPALWRVPHLQLIEYLAPAVDSPEMYRHDNGARRLVAVWMFVDHGNVLIAHELGAGPMHANAFSFDDRLTESVELTDHTQLLLTPRRAEDPPHVQTVAMLIEVDSLTRLKQTAGLEHFMTRGPAVWLSPSQVHGVWLGFVERTTWK